MNKKIWLWVGTTSHVTAFRLFQTRGAKGAKQLLGTDYNGIVGSDRYHDDPVTISAHSYDAYIEKATADAVIFPKTTAEVAETLVLRELFAKMVHV